MNILMVEDNAQDAELLKLTLERADEETHVAHAETLAQARQKVRHADYDVVLLDLGLPDSDGLTTVRQLQGANDSVPIVVFSGYDDDKLATEAVQLGAEDYMVKGDENGAGILRTIRHAIERQHHVQELRYRAHYDPLTGLSNRAEFLQALSRSIETTSEQTIGVFLVDLDRFNAVNTALGHGSGDQLLRETAQRIAETVSRGGVVARIDADEFVLFASVADERDAEGVAERVHEAFETPFSIETETLTITASIGVALSTADGGDAESLLMHAESAMREAKERGRNRTRFFSPEANERLKRRHLLRTELDTALKKQQFAIYYQPRFDRESRGIHSVATSLRWHHPSRGVLEPASFLPVAETEGLLDRIEEYYLDAFTGQLKSWSIVRDGLPFLSLSVSEALLIPDIFPEHVENILLSRAINPSLIEIGVPESTLAKQPSIAFENIHKLHDLGVRIAIKDYATGFAPLPYVTHLPVDSVNLTRAVVEQIGERATSALVHAVTMLAHDLGMSVTAEGIETDEQLRALSDLSCDVLQGNYLLEAVDADGMGKLLKVDEAPHRTGLH